MHRWAVALGVGALLLGAVPRAASQPKRDAAEPQVLLLDGKSALQLPVREALTTTKASPA